MVNSVLQSPMEGTSMLYTFNEPEADERHDLQYFEMLANRGTSLTAVEHGHQASHPVRVMTGRALPAFDDDVWELYDGGSDSGRTATWPPNLSASPRCNGSG